MAKKIIILRASGGELTNQLWNYASIYAYAREQGCEIENPSFFEYGNYFTMPAPNAFSRWAFFMPFTGYTARRNSLKKRLWRKAYNYYANLLISAHRESVIVSDNKENRPFYLPPTKDSEKLSSLEKIADTIYFDGWLFRNPAGIEKHRGEIREYFRPRKDISELIATEMEGLRSKYKNIVGVHLRQSDYKTWRGGAYLITQERARKIMDQYLEISGKRKDETCFVITSDSPVDPSLFGGLNIFISKNNAVHDLFLLADTDAVIGSNSTFGPFATYYGNVPFIVMQKGQMDWDYYRGKEKFFENKYSSFVYY